MLLAENQNDLLIWDDLEVLKVATIIAKEFQTSDYLDTKCKVSEENTTEAMKYLVDDQYDIEAIRKISMQDILPVVIESSDDTNTDYMSWGVQHCASTKRKHENALTIDVSQGELPHHYKRPKKNHLKKPSDILDKQIVSVTDDSLQHSYGGKYRKIPFQKLKDSYIE